MTSVAAWGQRLKASIERLLPPPPPTAVESLILELTKPTAEIDALLVKKLVEEVGDFNELYLDEKHRTTKKLKKLKSGTLLSLAMRGEQFEAAIMMIEKDADIEKSRIIGRNLLSYAIRLKCPETVVDALIERYKREPFSIEDPAQNSDAFSEAVDANDVTSMRKMLAAGIDPNYPNPHGGTGLSRATLKYHEPNRLIETLLEYGADPDYKPARLGISFTARETAREYGHTDLLKLFDRAAEVAEARQKAEADKVRADISERGLRATTIMAEHKLIVPRLLIKSPK